MNPNQISRRTSSRTSSSREVERAARAAGYTIKAYHGTPEAGFDVFLTDEGYTFGAGAYFTPEINVAREFMRKHSHDTDPDPVKGDIYEVFLKIERPYIAKSAVSVARLGREIYEDDRKTYDRIAKSIALKNDIGINDVGATEVANALLREQGYDGVIQVNFHTGEPVEYVVFSPNQIKAVDSSVPLSERFDESSPVIHNPPMNGSDNLIRRPIPFGDITEGEMDEFREMGREDGDSRRNPTGDDLVVPDVYNKYFSHLGRMGFSLADFINKADKAAYKVGIVDSTAEIRSVLEEMLKVARSSYSAGSRGEKKYQRGNYFRAIKKMQAWLVNPLEIEPPFPIFTKGNAKLPYWCFSALPATTCPFAGACLTKDPKKKHWEEGNRGWCYSFSGWAKVFPFFRQLQNTILIRLKDRTHIENDMRRKFKKVGAVRLYVDGDIDSYETLDFWMRIIRSHREYKFYGYSKSWSIFYTWHKRNGGNWPENYQLNLSSGTKYERENIEGLTHAQWVARMEQLPVVRGQFVAYPVDTHFPDKKKIKEGELTAKQIRRGYMSQAKYDAVVERYTAEVRAATQEAHEGRKVFVCPNYCGECLAEGKHACGNRGMKGVVIGIGIH